ncbi:MAG TPA: hypothetical protein VFE99_10480, partial [Agromyces sp.]|nr:hypothetical protein [Agromyces sp.]
MATAGSTDRGGHGRPSGALERGRSAMRRAYALLIGIAVTIVLFQMLAPQSGQPSAGPGTEVLAGALWALPAAAG